MVKAKKTLQKVLSGSKNIRFDDFVKLVEAFGFVLDRIRGSHHIFKHPDIPELLNIQPDSNGKVKPYQVKQLLALVEAYELELNGETDEEEEENA